MRGGVGGGGGGGGGGIGEIEGRKGCFHGEGD